MEVFSGKGRAASETVKYVAEDDSGMVGSRRGFEWLLDASARAAMTVAKTEMRLGVQAQGAGTVGLPGLQTAASCGLSSVRAPSWCLSAYEEDASPIRLGPHPCDLI